MLNRKKCREEEEEEEEEQRKPLIPNSAQAVKGQMTVPEHSPELSDTRAGTRPVPAPWHDNFACLGLSMFNPGSQFIIIDFPSRT